jgi:hypothetical protein
MNEVISRKGKSFDHDYLPWTAPPQSAVYTHPDEVLSDSRLTFDQKREVLVSWASDTRVLSWTPRLATTRQRRGRAHRRRVMRVEPAFLWERANV